MGLPLFGGSDDYDWTIPKSNSTSPNPNPKNFVIKRIEEIGNYLWVLANYPDCPSYGGDKILIYKNMSIRRLKLYKKLDPHFSETGVTPIARFRPDSEGVILSKKFCRISNKEE